MKCNLCNKTEGVKVIIAGGEVKDYETEDKYRSYIEDYLNKTIVGFPHLCPEHFLYVTKRIIKQKKSR